MTLEELQAAWAEDSKIDRSMLTEASLITPQLHYKYFKSLSSERVRLKKMEAALVKLKNSKYEFFRDGPDEETSAKGWKFPDKKPLKTEIPYLIDVDSEVVEYVLKIAIQQEKVDFLVSIINSINNRQWIIKNAIDFMKFENGE